MNAETAKKTQQDTLNNIKNKPSYLTRHFNTETVINNVFNYNLKEIKIASKKGDNKTYLANWMPSFNWLDKWHIKHTFYQYYDRGNCGRLDGCLTYQNHKDVTLEFDKHLSLVTGSVSITYDCSLDRRSESFKKVIDRLKDAGFTINYIQYNGTGDFIADSISW